MTAIVLPQDMASVCDGGVVMVARLVGTNAIMATTIAGGFLFVWQPEMVSFKHTHRGWVPTDSLTWKLYDNEDHYSKCYC